MKQFELIMFAGVLCLTACAEHPDLLGGGVELSDNQISFSTSTVNGWQGMNSGSRAAVIADENGPLKMESSLGHPLYLHPIEQSGTYIYNAKDELITRSGAPLPSDGNLLHADNASAKTRGAKFTGTSLTNAFGVSAILTNNNTPSSYFQNLKATPSGGSWITSEEKYWPTDGSLSFYAYYPYSTDSHGMLSEDTNGDVNKTKTVHYVASANDVEHQPDLIIAKHENVIHGLTEAPNSVGLNFSHVLTAITFAVGSDMVPGTVKSIAIKGVKNIGDYDLATGKWAVSGNDANFTISLGGGNGTQVNGTQDVALTSGDQTLMMIPQTFDANSNAKVEIVFTPTGGTDRTLSASLAGTDWTEGFTIIYKVSTSSLLPTLTLNKVTFPTNWSAQYAGNLKSTYSEDDKIGLYVVAPDGKVRAANVLVTYKNGKWSFPAAGQPHINTNDKVFAYYPYQKIPQGSLPSTGQTVDVATLADANAFFKTLEAAWSPNVDQSTMDKMNASDLQVANAILNNTGSGIDLTMAHAMGLADITIGTGQMHFKLSNDANYTWDNPHLASEQFADKKPCKVADAHYVAVVKPNVVTKFNSAAGVNYAWESELSFSPAADQIAKRTATPVDKGVNSFALELGDIYYSDGSLTHQSEDLTNGKTPIGIVGYIGQNKWTEYQTGSGHGGHALVMSLLTVGAYENGIGSNGTWFSPEPCVDYNTVKQNTPQIVMDSKNKDYGSGLLQTELFIKATYGPALALQEYRTQGRLKAPLGKSTGWFLPTAGQAYALYSQIAGGVSIINWTVVYALWDDSPKVTSQIDDYLKKVGEGHYTPLWGTGVLAAYALSSELNATQALTLFSDDGAGSTNGHRFGYMGLAAAGSGRADGQKLRQYPYDVRPFLAF